MSSEQFSNGVATTLSASINSSATSLTVVDGSTWPSSPQFRIKCENEIMIVTAISGNTYTVTRAAEGTTAASHNSGSAIVHLLTAGGLTNLSIPGATYDLLANRPAASKSGKLFIPSDSHGLYVDDGTNWNCRSLTKVTFPKASSFSFHPSVTSGNTLVDNNNGVLCVPVNSPLAIVKPLAYSAPYSIRMRIRCITLNYNEFGPMLYDTVSGRDLRISNIGTNVWYRQFSNLSTLNSQSQLPSSTNAGMQVGTMAAEWYGIVDDGTTRHYQMSPDGLNWFDTYTEANNTWITPNRVGIHFNNSQKGAVLIEHFAETTP